MTRKELLGDDWMSEEEMAAAREMKVESLRAERARGYGPPCSKDGRTTWYSRTGYREWMEKRLSGQDSLRSRRRR